jgi:uncharacterized protein YbjT (DUF2867 family)
MKKILVLGGTGLLGAPVVRRLLADAFEVRLLARDPEKAAEMFGEDAGAGSVPKVLPGDVTDVEALEAAMDGCDGVHISVGGPVDRLSAENVGALASKLGVKRVTYLSGSTVAEQNRWFPVIEQKVQAEAAVGECGVPYTIFCPTWPMEQLPRFVRDGRAAIIGDQPTYHWFAAEDLASMVSKAYRSEDAANKRLYIHGPEAITMRDALDRYRQVVHPEIEAVSVMLVEAARAMAASSGNEVLRFYAEFMAYFEQVGELGDPTEANQLLGAPGTTLDAWIAQQAARRA